MPKKSIRASILAQRRQLAPDSCAGLSHAAQNRLLAIPAFAEAAALALYSPVNNEVLTGELFHAARSLGKQVVFPRICGQRLEFVEVTQLAELQPGALRIREPRGTTIVPVTALDLLVVPGVAFDQKGGRLGYGKGFYDRTLHAVAPRPCLIGLCFEFQLVSALPVETHDVGVDMLVTEARTLHFYASPEPSPARV